MENTIDNLAKKTLIASPLPVKTWRYLKINQSQLEVKENLNCDASVLVDTNLIAVEDFSASDLTDLQKLFDFPNKCAVGNDVKQWVFSQKSNAKIFTVSANYAVNGASLDTTIESNLPFAKITVDLQEKEDSSNIFIIHAKKDSVSKFLFEATSSTTASGTAVIFVFCLLEENSRVEISQLQVLGENVNYISSIEARENKNARLTVFRGNFGSAKSYVALQTRLVGDYSQLESQLAYLTKQKQFLDINDIARHIGKNTKSNFNTQGVMKDESYKNYKGTIDFLRGCSGSEGDELEDVLLLSDDVVNKTTPLILCDEEEVVGNHGATLGKIDSSILFYMQCHGIDEEVAKLLIARGRLNKIISRIPSKNLVSKANECVDSAFSSSL